MTKQILVGLFAVLMISLAGKTSTLSAQDAPSKPATPEQIAEAKKFAASIGGRMKEDAKGNVISIDMAAGRTWADDYQMNQILVFPKLESLVVEGPGITNQLIPKIAEQSHLTSLTMKNTLVNDEGVAQLSGMKSLKVIDLRVSPLITDKAMESLVKIPTLKAVRLIGGNVTDNGVATLLKMPAISELDVRNCRGVTKAGVENIVQNKTIRVLKLGGSTVDDSFAAIVAGMKGLKSLSLENCNVTDAGVAKLEAMPLEELVLTQTAVTDAAVKSLAKITSLKQVTVTKTHFTKEGVEQLRKALPGCKIRS